MAENPYAAPSAKVADVAPQGEYVLAGRGDRLLAAIVDGLVMLPIIIFVVGPVLLREQPNTAWAGLALLWALVILIVDLVLLHKNGQTIGKKTLKIKIVRKDGSRATLGRIFWLRGFVNGLVGAIPYLGSLYSLVDILFIFGEPRRCIHDYIADTVVIAA